MKKLKHENEILFILLLFALISLGFIGFSYYKYHMNRNAQLREFDMEDREDREEDQEDSIPKKPEWTSSVKIPIYCINLKERKDRKQHVLESARRHNTKITFIEAIPFHDQQVIERRK